MIHSHSYHFHHISWHVNSLRFAIASLSVFLPFLFIYLAVYISLNRSAQLFGLANDEMLFDFYHRVAVAPLGSGYTLTGSN